jgi:ribose transport system ATP-binding protein
LQAIPGVKALDNVDFTVRKGEVPCPCRQKWSRKSTLMKICSGIYKKEAGSMKFNGVEVEVESPKDAERWGCPSFTRIERVRWEKRR